MPSGQVFPLRDDRTIFAATRWSSPYRVKSGGRESRLRTRQSDDLQTHDGAWFVDGRIGLELRRRKLVASRAILTRASCRERFDPRVGELRIPQLLCPVSAVWTIVRERARAGGLTFPSLQDSNFFRRWRSAYSLLGWPDADTLGAHPSRRGAAWASLSAGGTLAQRLRAGQSRGRDVRLYPYLDEGERRAMTGISMEGSDDGPFYI